MMSPAREPEAEAVPGPRRPPRLEPEPEPAILARPSPAPAAPSP